MKRHLLRFRTLYQFGFSLLIAVAIIAQFIYGIVQMHGISVSYVGLFISYFTILSNAFVAVVLWKEARANVKGIEPSARFERIRALAVFCILTTGITYAFFLKGPGAQGMVENAIPWINDVFHYIVPTVMTLDWLAFPAKRPTRWYAILVWIAVTIVYLLYVELLGLVTHVYPYFFVDPTTLHGYLGVTRACLGFLPFFAVFGAFVVLSNRLNLYLRRA